MKKRITAILLMTIMVLSTISFSLASTNFSDMSDHWAKANVEDLASRGIIDGYQDGTFKPEETVTYGEFIKMLVVAVTGENPGVSTKGHWASKYYEAAVENNLLKEDDIPENFLDKKIPRADMAYLASNSVDETLDDEKKELVEDYIKDIDKAGNRKSEVIFAYGAGILAGYPDGTFKPSGVLTRAESAAVISRIIEPSLRLEIDFEVPTTPQPNGDMPELTEDIKLNDYALTIPDSVKEPISEISGFSEVLKQSVKHYAIVDNSSYDFYITKNLLGNEAMSIKDGLVDYFSAILIKDNTVIQGTQKVNYQGTVTFGMPGYEGEKLPDFDYIGLYKGGDFDYDTMILIKNPFK